MPPTQEQLWSALSASDRLFLISGPCVIEDEALCVRIAEHLRKLCDELGVRYVFKASFDKANRTSSQSARGPGVTQGLAVLAHVRESLDVCVLTDVHTEAQVEAAAEVVDVLQIPAFLCRQTDLVQAAARSGRIVNLKKGQFLSPGEMEHVVAKAREAGGERILLTERGATFGYNDLVADLRSIPIMRRQGCPVVFDATHSVQQPGAGGDRSGGRREFVAPLARAAVAAGADGLFLETHPDPDRALSDGPNALALSDMGALLESAVAIHGIVRGCADVAGPRRSRA